MNHPSEWARFFEENTGSYRYKHKGSGVIRDTLMTIGKVFKGAGCVFTSTIVSLNIPEGVLFTDFVKRLKNDWCFHE